MCKEGFVAVVELSGAWRPGLGMEMLECQHPLTSAQLTVQRQSCALANMHVITLSAPAPPPPHRPSEPWKALMCDCFPAGERLPAKVFISSA